MLVVLPLSSVSSTRCLDLYAGLSFSQTIGTKPVAHIDQFTPDMLGSAELAEEVNLNGSGKLFKVTIYC